VTKSFSTTDYVKTFKSSLASTDEDSVLLDGICNPEASHEETLEVNTPQISETAVKFRGAPDPDRNSEMN